MNIIFCNKKAKRHLPPERYVPYRLKFIERNYLKDDLK